MTEHWNEHSLDFSRSSDKNFDSAEGNWDANETGFTIDTNTQKKLSEDDIKERRRVYEEPHPDVANLQKRKEYTQQVRADPSYRFLMMVAAFSKKNIGTVMKLVYKPKRYQHQYNPNAPGDRPTHFTMIEGQNEDTEPNDLTTNTTRSDKNAWLTMPEISGSIQLTPEVYGHIMEAQMIVGGFIRRPILLKTLVENPRYQTLFARLVAIRMGLTKYFDNSDKQKDRIFSRLHQEQSMLLRRIRTVKGEPTKDYTHSRGY